ncbi:retrotransposon protein, putative, ty3-gypsy subclass [Tanacetum coccineum]|uniref:Retrotransposon protein, putative, ty3-gypsy subclass n=1 Tax=Tanacetum coccineum TaxID=301880 RepID=A0ABQ5CFX3_9ASTR
MESSTSSQPYQPYSPINPTNLDMNFEDLMFSQEYNYSQDYSMGHGSGHEVSPVKPKKPSRRAAKAKKDETKEVKEPPKEWTVEEEIALCQGWCDVSENNISGNSMKAKGFWEAVIRYFEKETGSTRGYDSIVSKWKNRVRPKIGAFCAIIKNIEANHESGTNDLDVYQKACAEFKMIYKGDFNLEHCYNILKDHPGWTDVEMPHFFKIQGRKKSKTSETTSGSASGGINLNEEADEAVQETQEFRPMGRDRAKAKKKAVGSSSSIVDLVADKFYNMKPKKEKRKTRNNRLLWR